MAVIRARLYPKVTDAVFEREWRDLVMAISEPAAYFHLRGWNGSAGVYMTILGKALDALAQRGNVLSSRNRPTMLRAWLQTHLRNHGDTYLEEVKAADLKVVASVASAILRNLKPVAANHEARTLTETLVAARGLLAPPSRSLKCP